MISWKVFQRRHTKSSISIILECLKSHRRNRRIFGSFRQRYLPPFRPLPSRFSWHIPLRFPCNWLAFTRRVITLRHFKRELWKCVKRYSPRRAGILISEAWLTVTLRNAFSVKPIFFRSPFCVPIRARAGVKLFMGLSSECHFVFKFSVFFSGRNARGTTFATWVTNAWDLMAFHFREAALRNNQTAQIVEKVGEGCALQEIQTFTAHPLWRCHIILFNPKCFLERAGRKIILFPFFLGRNWSMSVVGFSLSLSLSLHNAMRYAQRTFSPSAKSRERDQTTTTAKKQFLIFHVN